MSDASRQRTFPAPRRRRAGIASALAASIAMLLGCAHRPASADGGVPMVWEVETSDGKVIDAHDADRGVNPASVVKLATSLRALDTLGPDHRFVTTFSLTKDKGRELASAPSSLVIEGGADPDFHFENAMLVAHALEEAGVTHLRGDLYVGERFWMGWEHGTAGRETDPVRRRHEMGERLLQAWTPSSWNQEQRTAWTQIASRQGWNAAHPVAIAIDGHIRTDAPPDARPVVVHRSEPLLVALRRFNVFSNNDIERLDASIGGPEGLPAFLEKHLGHEAASTSFSTSSGLNRNRMSPRVIVRMLHELRSWLAAKGLSPSDLMPVLGCGESTLQELFPRLVSTGVANGLVGKTGTLNVEDGGVSALAGFLPAGPGLVFFVEAPQTGADLRRARAAEEEWVRNVLLTKGDLAPVHCPAPVPTSDALADIARPTELSRR